MTVFQVSFGMRTLAGVWHAVGVAAGSTCISMGGPSMRMPDEGKC